MTLWSNCRSGSVSPSNAAENTLVTLVRWYLNSLLCLLTLCLSLCLSLCPALRDNRIELVHASWSELTISISDVTLSDEGMYTCSLFTMPVRTAKAYLTVLGKYKIWTKTCLMAYVGYCLWEKNGIFASSVLISPRRIVEHTEFSREKLS